MSTEQNLRRLELARQSAAAAVHWLDELRNDPHDTPFSDRADVLLVCARRLLADIEETGST